MAWRGSLSRSLISARASTIRTSPSLPRIRPPPLAAPRRPSFANPRNLGELGCVQSLLPLYSVAAGVRLTSHLAVRARACCELYNGRYAQGASDLWYLNGQCISTLGTIRDIWGSHSKSGSSEKFSWSRKT